MGLCLIATGWLELSLWIAVLKVLVGLGLVIFVHELGHFMVAKLCGVKCEKFYLGFDIAGLKLFKFTRGETEYGIGILPLGGYVKMLGQEDNPARLRAELNRAKLQQADQAADPAQQAENPGKAETAQTQAQPPQGDQIDIEATERALFDPRSYLAKSVPKRMAIISAGVIMNMVFAFVIAVVAFRMGVERDKCVVGQTIGGEGAWQANLKVGDEIVEIAGRKIEKFRDLQEAVSLGDDVHKGIPIVVRRPGEKKLLTFIVMPDSSGLAPRIGILSSSTTTLQEKDLAVLPGSAAARATPRFRLGDTIVQVDDTPVRSYADLYAYLALHPDKPLAATVERGVNGEGRETRQESRPSPLVPSPSALPDEGCQQVVIEVPASPMRRLGLVMEMGRVSAVQDDSPAAVAGIRPGDSIVAIDGQPPGDPITLPDRLRRRAGETITVRVKRGADAEAAEDIQVTLRPPDSFEMPAGDIIPLEVPVTVPALGIAYPVLNRVESVIEGSPAAKAGLHASDEIVSAKVKPPAEQTAEEEELGQRTLSFKFDAKNQNWAAFIFALQKLLPGTDVQLQWVRHGEEASGTLQPVAVRDCWNPDRGLLFEPLVFVEKAGTLGEAVRLGAEETGHETLVVYRTIQKLGSRQVSLRALGGPISIFEWLKRAAEQSFPKLLITLTFLSANLAVINFLPIPLLDGGHMVLLAWEGIRGKPADERVQVVLTYIGLVFVLSLMIWVIGLDIFRLASGF